MQSLDKMFSKHKFIPVIIIDDIDRAVPLARALLDGGIAIMEVTLRTENALAIIEKLNAEVPEMLTGAGTILSDDHYHMAVKHGAKFIISPGITSELIAVSRNYELPFIPGAITPTEIMKAHLAGFSYLKNYPCEAFNGYDLLRSYASPFAQMKFCPTGGITLNNAPRYLALPNVVGVGCTFIAPPQLIAKGDFTAITTLAKQAMALV